MRPLFSEIKSDIIIPESLKAEFPEQLEFEGIMDHAVTGNFEVFVNGALVHSKRAGKGKATTEAERNDIKAYIRRELSSKA